MKATLQVDDAQKIRIFESVSEGAEKIIGPTKGQRYEFPNLDFDIKTFGMEATQYADENFDGLVTITFCERNGTKFRWETGVVRVAPWLMPSHMDPTRDVYVMETPDNAKFVSDLEAAVGTNNLVKIPGATYGDDRWMQDIVEIGFSGLPCAKKKEEWLFPVALRTAINAIPAITRQASSPKKNSWDPIMDFCRQGN